MRHTFSDHKAVGHMDEITEKTQECELCVRKSTILEA